VQQHLEAALARWRASIAVQVLESHGALRDVQSELAELETDPLADVFAQGVVQLHTRGSDVERGFT
jgi:hypothetical protein